MNSHAQHRMAATTKPPKLKMFAFYCLRGGVKTLQELLPERGFVTKRVQLLALAGGTVLYTGYVLWVQIFLLREPI